MFSTTTLATTMLPAGRLRRRLGSAVYASAAAVRQGAAVVGAAAIRAVTRVKAFVRGLRRSRAADVVGRAAGSRAGTAAVGDRPALRASRTLSAVVMVLMAAAAAGGLAWRGLYQDPPATAAMFRAYDLGSLTVATPLLAATLAHGRSGSSRADLLRAGVLAYAAYTYAYYVFGAAFNALFLVHVALLALATLALALTVRAVDVPALSTDTGRWPRVVAAVLALLAGSLGGMWTVNSVRVAVTGAAPPAGLLVQPPPIDHLGYALDLTTLVPAYAAGAVLLWRRRPWGFVLGAVLLVASAIVQVNYVLALLVQAAADIPGATAFDPQEPYIAAAIIGAAVVLLGRRSVTAVPDLRRPAT